MTGPAPRARRRERAPGHWFVGLVALIALGFSASCGGNERSDVPSTGPELLQAMEESESADENLAMEESESADENLAMEADLDLDEVSAMDEVPVLAADEPAADIGQYRLGPGDRLNVTVFGQPDMSGEFEIDGAGQVTLPLVGPIDSAGYSVGELTGRITRRLDEDFLVDPQIAVEVLNYRPFYILGEVKSPGSYAYVAGISVRQAIAIAGGFTRRGSQSGAIVIRDTKEGRVSLPRTSLDAAILPGDTIEVERRLF